MKTQAIDAVDHAAFFSASVHGQLQTPLSHELRDSAGVLLSRGERRIVLDLAALSGLDASGIGEIVDVFNMAAAVGGTVRMARARTRVRRMLQIVGLLMLLEEMPDPYVTRADTAVPPALMFERW